MAGIANNNNSNEDPYNPSLYLSPNQQDLLLAALSSNHTKGAVPQSADNKSFVMDMNGNFPAAQSFDPLAFDNVNYEDTPYIDPLDVDGSFDYGFDNDAAMIGPLPDDEFDSPTEGDMHDKRKSPSDGTEPDEGNKRHEPEEKTAKKPGRKPLTSEPTTKRKAQNRAAQRAFRERKEKHLKDLETKVEELEKQSESANHENGLLRAQVARLQSELREYRKRLSLNRSGMSGSPPSAASGISSYLAGLSNSAGGNNFQFEFPRFGGLPGGPLFNSGSISKSSGTPAAGANHKQSISGGGTGVLSRSDSSASQHVRAGSLTASPGRNVSTSAPSPFGALGGVSNGDDSNGVLGNSQHRSSTDSSSARSRVFQFNSNSNSASPSTSSMSYQGPTSSCGTSPEPSHSSPKDSVNEHPGYVCHGNSEGEISFCEKLNMACGNPRNPIPRAKSMDQSMSNGSPAANNNGAAAAGTTPSTTPALEATSTDQSGAGSAKGQNGSANNYGFDLLATQNGGQFDPSLFGDYRESQAAIVGDGDFTSGFFNEAFPFPDFGSPLSTFGNTGLTPAVERKTNPMDIIDKIQNGEEDDEVVPGEAPGLSCHQIWDKLQKQPGFTDGTFNIDNLCSELRAKAKCSESGVVVDQRDVDEALKRLPQRT